MFGLHAQDANYHDHMKMKKTLNYLTNDTFLSRCEKRKIYFRNDARRTTCMLWDKIHPAIWAGKRNTQG